MRAFWDDRAREDAYYFVDNRRAYRDSELETFWSDGERDLDRILGLLDLQIAPADVVLDIGCGVGRLSRPLAGRARHVYAVDISSEMLDRARQHHRDISNVEWLLGDGRSLRPVDDAAVDACVSHVVFQHIPDPQITLGYVAEMGRVLKPGGWAAFQVSNAPALHRPSRRLASWLRRGPHGQDDPAWLGVAIELDDLRRVATASDLELERVVGEGTQFCLVLARRAA